ncbi:MAG: tetrahydrofolate dehydrogenase/cyclohydrolase catalytic domain-containing protein [Eubacteriales bacterium]|nr:tetrahydrofolate dehydrogenase/cyclohydrolase catalytic domain-containing protein [Eubacteriales bacterium]
MATQLMGNEVNKLIQSEVLQRSNVLISKGIVPTLGIIRVGEKSDDIQYERSIERCFSKLNISISKIALPENVTQTDLLDSIQRMNDEPKIHGILLFRPLPKHLVNDIIVNSVAPQKDIDGMSDASLMGILLNKKQGFAPCTAEACLEIIDYYGIDIAGKNVVVIGRSNVIGKPVSLLLLNRNATVTMCHSKTENLPAVCKRADILVCATGRAKMVNSEFVREGQCVIDVGIFVMPDGTVCGDVDFDSVNPIVDSITPVPRGVGSVTTASLARHLICAAENCNG